MIFLLASLTPVLADSLKSVSQRLLPAQIGQFKKVKSGGDVPNIESNSKPVATERAEFTGNSGERLTVEIIRFQHDGDAYELLSLTAAAEREKQPALELNTNTGTAGFSTENQLAFFKGSHFVRITSLKGESSNLTTLAQTVSESLDPGEGEIPVLIQHLPHPEEAQKNAIYLNTFATLEALPPRPVFTAIDSAGNADAALATYGPSKVLVIEFNTPQLAADNDRKIVARIQELWKLGQPAPTAYRRVGNYSVFVFDAPDEQTAKQLMDQVRYEQVVQWLGENPNILAAAERHYYSTTLGVLVAVLKASGFALIACLGLGGLIGALLFSHRRAQQRTFTAFSDAGGMMRLNLDDLSADLTNRRR